MTKLDFTPESDEFAKAASHEMELKIRKAFEMGRRYGVQQTIAKYTGLAAELGKSLQMAVDLDPAHEPIQQLAERFAPNVQALENALSPRLASGPELARGQPDTTILEQAGANHPSIGTTEAKKTAKKKADAKTG